MARFWRRRSRCRARSDSPVDAGLDSGVDDESPHCKQPAGYTMVALNAIGKMERQQGGAWVDVPVKPLLAKERKSCREAAND